MDCDTHATDGPGDLICVPSLPTPPCNAVIELLVTLGEGGRVTSPGGCKFSPGSSPLCGDDWMDSPVSMATVV